MFQDLTILIGFYTTFAIFSFLLAFFFYEEEFYRTPKLPASLPKLSVVIPAYNEEKWIGQCLSALLLSDYPKDLLEVIVIDDGSQDRTYEIASSFPVKVFRKKNEGGKSYALNFGVKKATGELIATMDADSLVRPDTLKKLVAYFQDPDVWAVTAAIKAKPKPDLLTQLQYIEYSVVLFMRKMMEMLGVVHVTPGGLSVFRREVFQRFSFDPKSLCEDHEIALQIVKAGKRIAASLDAVVYTEVPDSLLPLLRQRIRWISGTIYNCLKHLDLLNPSLGNIFIYVIPLDLSLFLLTLGFTSSSLANLLLTPTYPRVFLGFMPWEWFGVAFLLTLVISVPSVFLAYLGEELLTEEVVDVPLKALILYFPFWIPFMGVVYLLSLGGMQRWEKSR